MQTTIKRTDVGANGKDKGPLCPFWVKSGCLGKRCELYNDDARGCVFSPISLHLLMRTAITDAAVEISRYMGDGRIV